MVPKRVSIAVVALVALFGCAGRGGSSGGSGGATTLRVSGSTTVNPVAADAAAVLRTKSLAVTVDTQGGSAGGLTQLGDGQIDIAMSSKPVSDDDRRAHPNVNYVSTHIGEDAVGLIVRREIVDAGLRNVTRAQARDIFEARVTNWKALGGGDLAIFVYDKEPGRGTREVLDRYLYGSEKAPAPPASDRFAIVGGNEETRTKLESTPGSVGPLSVAFATGRDKLAVLAVDGITPTPATIANHTYPLSRPLYLVTNGDPTGAEKAFIDYLLGPEGQKLVTKHGYLTLAQIAS